MLKSIKIRLYPNIEQEIYINRLLGSCRFVFNNCLNFRIDKYNNENIFVGLAESSRYLTSLKTMEEYYWLKESHSKVLAQVVVNLDNAYKNFFKNGNGFPNFKSKKDNMQSCRFPKDAISKNSINGNRINIIKPLKNILFKCSKNDEKYLNKNKKDIRSGTLSKNKVGHYYFSILIDRENDKILPKTNNILGIDLGIKDFIVDSNGNSYENIKVIRNNEKKLKKLHRSLSKKVNGSSNKEKCRKKLAKFNLKLHNIKENYLHTIVNQLLNENQVIVIEDLNVKGMMTNHCLAKSIQELSLYRFKEILTYKSNWFSRDIIQIDKWFPSSKLCSCCGYKNNDLTLSDRIWVCSNCKTNHDRDFNAAINIRKEGERINKIGLSSPKLTLQESNISCSLNEEKNVINNCL